MTKRGLYIAPTSQSKSASKADPHEVACLKFLQVFIRDRYADAADFRSTENAALCQIFEELLRRAFNEISAFLDDIEAGRSIGEEIDLTKHLGVTILPGFECVFAELARTKPESHEAHINYLFELRAQLRQGMASTLDILRRRKRESTPMILITVEHVATLVVSQLFEIERVYCGKTGCEFKPADDGTILSGTSFE